jgi:hypothetical protein
MANNIGIISDMQQDAAVQHYDILDLSPTGLKVSEKIAFRELIQVLL